MVLPTNSFLALRDMQDNVLRLSLAVLWGILAIPLVLWARNTARQISSESELSRLAVVVVMVVSFTTGWVLWGVEALSAATIVVAWVLFVVQGVLDATTHRLSRPVTWMALIGTMGLVTVRVTGERNWTGVFGVVLVAAIVVVLFWIMHWRSAESLGFGDVLLVAPLSLLLGSINPRLVMFWLALSSMTGALHGVIARRLRKEKRIPFGPHLLFGTWLLLMISV